MNKIFSTFLFIILSLHIAAFADNYKVSYDPDYEPYTYSIDHKPYGLLIDILNIWAEENNHTLEFIEAKTWDDAIALVKDEKVDFFAGTDAYESWMSDSIIIYKTKTSLYKLKENKRKEKNIIGIISDDYKEIFEKDLKDITSQTISYDTYKALVDDLINGKLDLIYDDKIALDTYLMQNRLNHLIEKKDSVNIFSDIHVISKDDKKIKKFNKGFEKLTNLRLLKLEENWIINQEDRYYKNRSKKILSDEEVRWLYDNPISRVAIMNYWPKDDNGDSLHTEVLKLINKYMGTNIVPVRYDMWKDGFEDAIKGKKLHGIMGLSWSKEREDKYFYYTAPYDFTPAYLVVRKNNYKINELDDLKNKTIYLKEKAITHNLIKDKEFLVNTIDMPDVETMYDKLSKSDEADALLSYFIDKEKLDDYGLKIAKVVYDRYGEVSIGINHKYPVLSSIIQKAYKNIPRDEISKLRDKDWEAGKKKTLNITRDEQKWLLENHTFKYVYDPDFAPFEWMNDAGEHKGMTVDIMKMISDKSNITFEPVYSKSWADAIENIKQNKAMIYSAVSSGQLKDKNVKYTKNVLFEIPCVLVSKIDDTKIYLGLEDAFDKKLAVVKSSALDGYLKENFPQIKTIKVETNIEGIEKLSKGEIDLFVLNASTAEYFIKVKGFEDIKVSTKIDFTYKIKMAVSDNAPKELLSVLNKTIETISQKEISDIHYKWTNIVVSEKIDWEFILQIVGAISLIVIFLIINNAKLNQKVQEKTANILKQKKELEDLSKNLEVKVEQRTKKIDSQKKQIETILANILLPVLITSKKDRIILYANKYAEYQYETKIESLIGSSIDEVYTSSDQKDEILQQLYEKGFVENLEQHYKTFSGKEFIGLLSVKPIIYDGEEAFIGMVTDITHQKTIEEEIREIHKQTRDSIEYASLIQHSIIPDNEAFRKYFKEYFAIWHPKDVVGGDIYLFEELRDEDECLLMVIDCTGHGVPGAFVTMLVKAIERQIIAKIKHDPDEVVSPANLLGVFNRSMKHLLKQDNVNSISNAGFDGGILYYNKKQKIVKFSGAETPLFYVKDGELKTLRGSRHSVGYKKSDVNFEFKDHVIEVKEGMQFYLATDGYIDQNGGHKGFPFGKRRFGEIIKEYHMESSADQQEVFLDELHKYQGEEERNDDITLIGLKI